MRAVSGYDFDRAAVVATWPLHEVLISYMDKMKRNGVEEYRNSVLVWAALAPHQKKKSQPPKLPEILKDS